MTQSLTGVLLVEDDEGDALLVRECLREAGIADGDVTWRRTVREGISALADHPSCVLLDLGLPDAQGLDALHALVAQENAIPVIVLTGRHDRTGVDAVAAGAQDYLVKDDITPEMLDRTIRYAVQRRQAQLTEFQLREERLLATENARLERGLLPRPLLSTDFVRCASHYRPGRARAVLGGDFFDVVETADGRIRAVIGDVMGHGPDEAAIGVHLRVAWRALVLADVPDDQILTTLSRLLEAESGGGIFVTVCDLTLGRDLELTVRVAGHPPPLHCVDRVVTYLDVAVGPPLGVHDEAADARWPVTRTSLTRGSSLVLFTDGLLEAYRRPESQTSVGLDELLDVATAALSSGEPVEQLVTTVVGHAPTRAADDTALVVLTVGDPQVTALTTAPAAGSSVWSLRRRVNWSIIGVLLLLLSLIAVIVGLLVDAKRQGDEVVNRWDPAFLTSQNALAAMVNQESGVRGFALGRDEQLLQPYNLYSVLESGAQSTLRRYLRGNDELIALLNDYRDAVDVWQTTIAMPVIERVRAGDPTAVDRAGSEEAAATFDQIRVASSRLTDAIDEQRSNSSAARERSFTYVWIGIAIGTGVLLIAAGLLWRGLRRSVLRPIDDLADQTRVVAEGSLGRHIVQSGPSEILDLGRDVEVMRARLAAQIERIEQARLRLEQRSAELARSNADLEQFAYVASHDLSEPLRKVTNFCQLLERQYADQLDDKARQYIGFMVDGAKRMQSLINDLLSFSRVGHSIESFVPVDLDSALTSALANLDVTMSAAGAEVVVRGTLPTVPGDPILLTALFQNLVANAIKYRSPDRPSRTEVSAEQQDGHWLVTVDDNGIGIDPQYAERIFTIFQRLHLREEYDGTGIGLALCRKIVDFHRGHISLVEKADPGARFQFTLPVTQAPMETVDDDEPEVRAHA